MTGSKRNLRVLAQIREISFVLHLTSTNLSTSSQIYVYLKYFFLILDERSCSPAKESPSTVATTTESQLLPGLLSDLRVWNSWESNEGSEPQLTVQEEVFTFSSPPHSPKRGQSQGDQAKIEMGDDRVQSKRGGRHYAQPEDDFIGSESDEVCWLQQGGGSTHYTLNTDTFEVHLIKT